MRLHQTTPAGVSRNQNSNQIFLYTSVLNEHVATSPTEEEELNVEDHKSPPPTTAPASSSVSVSSSGGTASSSGV